jgi:alpha-mannosidase
LPFESAVETNLLEEARGSPIKAEGHSLTLSVKPWEIRTIKFLTK